MHRRRRTALVLSAALAAAAPLLTACGSDAHPGAAAVVGNQRITVAQLENRVTEVRDAQRTVATDQNAQAVPEKGTLARAVLHNMVLDRVLHRAAENAGVTVTRKEVQELRSALEQQAGGAKALEAAWVDQYGIAPERLDDNLHLRLEAQKLATDLGTETGTPAFWSALSKASKELDVDLNPRYGTWDVKTSSRVDTKTPWVREVTTTGSEQTT
ncbi:SurA N-terminal domain-containing protein [Streptomyces sp. NPDC005374]|uniref:SurA N-terminal domain-containing protein n=1 Tax=Streptomyces sp. NPDC005374 TaxID=3364713 RepID=UPI0036A43ED8